MKITNWKNKILLILFISTIFGSMSAQGGLSVGLTYNFTRVYSQEFVNNYNDQFKSVTTQYQQIRVVGFNETGLNYTQTLTQDGSSSATLYGGQWSQQNSNTKTESYQLETLNLTNQINNFNFLFDFYDNPTWNPAWNQSYISQIYPNLNYQNKFLYFDQKNESNPDNTIITYNLPNIVKSSNVQSFVSLLKDRIEDRLAGTVKSFKIKYFNASSNLPYLNQNALNNEWFIWMNSNLKSNVAYSVNLTNVNQGILKFTPQWLGRSNYLYSQGSYNYSTGQYQPFKPYLTTNDMPITYNSFSNTFSINNQPNTPDLFSIMPLNEKQPNYSKYFSVSASGLSLNIHATTLYQEPPSNTNQYYYYSSSHFDNPNNQITGTFTFNLNIQYDSNGFLIKENSNTIYDAGSYGKYTISNQFSKSASNSNSLINTNLVLEIAIIPVSVGTGIGLAYFLKKRRGT